MKNLLTLLLLLVAGLSYSQQVYDLDKKKTNEPKTEEQLLVKSKETKDKAIYQGKELPVYVTDNGKLFIIVMSKKGNLYRRYINVEKEEK